MDLNNNYKSFIKNGYIVTKLMSQRDIDLIIKNISIQLNNIISDTQKRNYLIKKT